MEEILNDDEQFVWFSKKQRQLHNNMGSDGRLFVKLNTGKIVEYTMLSNTEKHKANFDDIVLLGKGKYHHGYLKLPMGIDHAICHKPIKMEK